MKRRIAALSLVGAALAIGGTALAHNASDPIAAPAKVDNFRLTDNQGFAQDLRRLVDVKAIVLVTQVNGDAFSRRAAHALEALKTAHPGVEFLMMNSSPAERRADVAAEAKSQGYTIPVMYDDLQLVSEQLGVSYGGEAFVIEPKTYRVLYHGPVDASGAAKPASGYLAEALSAVEGGKPVAVADVVGKGAAIKLDGAPRHAIAYTKDVAPILEAKCVVCHQAGGIGPFAMTNYAVVKGFAPMIREAIRTRTMPPWHPDPTVGVFNHNEGLSPDETRTLVHWVEAGAPRGEGNDPLAGVAHVAPDWPLGKPDLVINVPAYTVPASGVVDYQYPSAPNPLTQGHWVKAATILPGNRQATHHILSGYIPGPARSGPGSAMQWQASYGEYAVGGESFIVPDEMGIYLPAGGSMGFQMHYTPFGKETVDTSKMGFYFYPEGQTPKTVLRHFVIANRFIEIPPNDQQHKEVAYTLFPKDAYLYSAFLHTHYRGRAARLDLVLPNGAQQTLISLPRYDFNWQRTYSFAKPISIPAGSKLVATYWYDNTVRNAANPDPNKTIVWGDQSWEEMHYTSIYYQWKGETVADPADATPEMMKSRLIGMLDANLDGKVERSELRGRIAELLLPHFDELDVNHDGGLDQSELDAATKILMPVLGRAGRSLNAE